MKNWWIQLNVREQQLVSVLAVFVVIFLFFNLIWQPLNENLDKTEKKLARQQNLLAWVTENTARYKAAEKSGNKNARGGSLSSVVNRSAKQHQIVITRVQPQGSDIQVWIDEIPFTQLLTWLESLTTKNGLRVNSIDITKSDVKGIVKIRRLQLGKG